MSATAPVEISERTAVAESPRALRTLLVLHGEAATSPLPPGVVADAHIERVRFAAKGHAGVDPSEAVTFVPPGMTYGERQKLALDMARQRGFDVVVLTPHDHACDLARLADLLRPIREDQADLVLGSRFMHGKGPAAQRMGWARALGHAWSAAANRALIGSKCTDIYAGYRAVRVSALRDIPFEQNSSDRRFDVELLIQFHTFGRRVLDVPVDTVPGGGRSPAGFFAGVGTWLKALKCDLRFFLHQKGFLHHPLFDNHSVPYQLRTDEYSVHHWVIQTIPPGSRVLDLGCSDGYVARCLRAKGCRVVGVDLFDSAAARADTDEFFIANLDDLAPVARQVDFSRFDVVIALDVIEHLSNPEDFLRTLRANIRPGCQVILSTANVAYWIVRIMLLLGQFNYGKRGILDITHKRLFTRATFPRACRVTGFVVKRLIGIPPPVHYVVPAGLGHALTGMHNGLSRLIPSWFGFQLIVQITPTPTVEQLWKMVESRAGAGGTPPPAA